MATLVLPSTLFSRIGVPERLSGDGDRSRAAIATDRLPPLDSVQCPG